MSHPVMPNSCDVSVVIIGRNEGARLTRCLTSVRAADWSALQYELVYVDSNSTDDSVTRARDMAAEVLVLEDPLPCASKARNLGWTHAKGTFILFLDGDTQLHPDFVQHALKALTDPCMCAAWGHRRESHPEKSIYNRLLDLDWIYPIGQTLYFGGDVLVRRQALHAVGGYDSTLRAGEEPEMCARLRALGWVIGHIDVPMTLHDLNMTRFKSYWMRAYRSGIAYAEVAERMRSLGDVLWQREARRDFRHGIAFLVLPWLVLLHPAMIPIGMIGSFLLVWRTARRCAWKAPGQPLLCWQYAIHAWFQKIPAFFGQLHWRRARRFSLEIQTVDYKEQAVSDVDL